MNWAELQQAVPEIARAGAKRLEETRIALLATVRKDGSPRVSPIEPYFTAGHMLLGVMAWSAKARDLRRDPRCCLHSTIAGPDSGEAELKLFGRAVAANADIVRRCSDGWWTAAPDGSAYVVSLEFDEAVLVEWDLKSQTMTTRKWSSEGGYRTSSRPYP